MAARIGCPSHPFVAMTPPAAGPLHGRTLLRFAHAYAGGGGTERYLDDLDRSLLERSAARVIRLFLTRDPADTEVRAQQVGQGTLLLVPLAAVPVPAGGRPVSEYRRENSFREFIRHRLLRHPLAWHLGVRRWNRRRRLPLLPGQAINAGAATRRLLAQYPIDLAILHYAGGADAQEILEATQAAGVPRVYVNHYANDRLDHLAIRKHLEMVDRVGGVNGLQVPRDLRARFANLSDGIDTNFFRRSEVRDRSAASARPVLFLPARITREKGQLDLLQALARLVAMGLDCEVALAGRIDASTFPTELRHFAAEHGLESRVHFLGDLDLARLREAYARAALMVFPTYHCEGLGRVTIESQAMETPALAYATGGVAEGIHDGVTGHVVRTGDLTRLTDHIAHLLRHPEERRRMGSAGRRFVEERFSLARLAERHETCYLKLMRPRSSA
jgi:phosphatidylinositol alpha-1,6-mannosyltransferase